MLFYTRVPLGEEEDMVKSLSLLPEESSLSEESKMEDIKVASRSSADKIEAEVPRIPPSTTKKKKKVLRHSL